MRVERIAKTWPRPNTRCSAEINDGGKANRDRYANMPVKTSRNWHKHNGKDYLCERDAALMIDGRPYCRLHGGGVLIDYHLKSKHSNPQGKKK